MSLSRVPGLLKAIYRNRRGRANLPRFLTYIVTFTCNARCIMCDSWKKDGEDDLSLEEIEAIFQQLPRMDAVRLSGGEPFVRRDLLEIERLVQERLNPLAVHITSNGFLTDRIVRFCEERQNRVPLHLLISVDGVGAKHNTVRGRDIAWESVMKTLKALAPRRKELGLQIAVNQTIVDSEGVDHYSRLREMLRPLGIHNNIVIAYEESATYSVESGRDVAPLKAGDFVPFGTFTVQDMTRLLNEAEEDLKELPFAEGMAKRYYLRGARSRLLEDAASPNPACVAVNSHMRLLPNGDVPTCQFNGRVIGNLRRQGFEEVWFGLNALKQREWVRRCAGCWAECEILPSAIYTGDLLKESLPLRSRVHKDNPSPAQEMT